MNRLFSQPGPRVFACPPGVDFAAELVRGLHARLAGMAPETLANITLAVNTRRTRTALVEAFEARGEAIFLPRLAIIDQIGAGGAGAAPAVDRLTRRLTLGRLVEEMLRADPSLGPPLAADALAASLADLLDETQRERVSLDALDDAVEDGVSEDIALHWHRALDFLGVMRTLWPDQLAADPVEMDPEARRAAERDALLVAWADAPPQGTIIAAGSTGSQRLTADLLVAIARLPDGAIVLPGFDFGLEAADWARLGPEHPQYGFARLMARLEIGPADIRPWTDRAAPPRARLLTEALAPAPVTARWRAALPALTETAAAATAGLELIEAPTPRAEAEAIALVMRHALTRGAGEEQEGTETVALVTPDRGLARRVAAALGRWGLVADDSSGRPLSLTPPGVYLRLLADVLFQPYDPARLLALLKHPFCTGSDPVPFRQAVAALEVDLLRRASLARQVSDLATLQDMRVASGIAREEDPLSEVFAIMQPWPAAPRPVTAQAAAFRRVARALAPAVTWEKPDERAADEALTRLDTAAPLLGDAKPEVFRRMIDAALDEGGDVRGEAYLAHPRLKIWGPLEARAQRADTMILSGLNEGVWPQAPAVDPWLSRPMRARIGMPAPERRIGLSAHDFLQAALAPRAVLTRALKSDGVPTNASRWLVRLTTLLSGVAEGAPLAEARARGDAWLALSEAANAAPSPRPAPRPAPCPPAGARPKMLFVTDIEALIRDPYSVYAKRVLALRALDDLTLTADARVRGQVLHDAVERFLNATLGGWPGPDAEALYDEAADAAVAASGADAADRLAWAARLRRVKRWFLSEEARRRAEGAPLGAEVSGTATIPTAGGPFTLKGRADRIDRQNDGTLAVYDYKANEVPSDAQIARFAKQLPLLALIAETGGFAGVDAAPAGHLGYLRLTGQGEGGKEKSVPPDPDARAHFIGLIEAFQDPAQPYLPRAYPEEMKYASDYDHLSRYGEWTDRPADQAPEGSR